jgi:lipopolysaccharide export system ATP-binding protein
MGYLPQQSSIFAKLTVQQNLLAMMQLLKMDRKAQKKRCDELLEQFQIAKLRKSRAGKLSGGERRRLEIARCLVSNPEIIMLDEPFAGIDPVTVQNIQEVIRELRNSGLSILITDHAAREILQITDRTYVVSEGKILCSGSAFEIVQNEEVKRKYLGEIDFVRSDRIDEQQARFDAAEPLPVATQRSTLAGDPQPPLTSSSQNLSAVDGVELGSDGLNSKEMPESEDATIPFYPVDPSSPKKRSRSAIRRPNITKTEFFDDIEAPFSSRDIE